MSANVPPNPAPVSANVRHRMSVGLIDRDRVSRAVTTWPFLAAVSLLAANDLYLKAAYSNWITGKLSDFSGIFFVSVLLFSAFPRTVSVYRSAGLIVLAFAVWKSPLSQPLIDVFQSLGIARIGRVVDYSDLVALTLMPAANLVASNTARFEVTGSAIRNVVSVPIVALTFVAILGTTLIPYTERYSIRKMDGDAPFDPALAARVIADVAGKRGLRCTACDKPTETAEYRGNGIWMRYSIRDKRNISFFIEGFPGMFRSGPTSEMEALARDLKKEFGSRLGYMEFVMPLSDPAR